MDTFCDLPWQLSCPLFRHPAFLLFLHFFNADENQLFVMLGLVDLKVCPLVSGLGDEITLHFCDAKRCEIIVL